MAGRFRVAVLTSTNAPGVESLVHDPNRGILYDLADVVVRRNAPRNLRIREGFDAETAEILRDAGADWVVLAGYGNLVTRPLLSAFPERILALHDGDLTLRDDEGVRRYAMLDAVRRAVFAGAHETRASLFFVTERFGEGPLMLVGPPFPVSELAADAIAHGAYDMAVAYARLHRDWMRSSYGDLLVRAMEIIAAGTMALTGEVAWIDGAPGPCRLGDAPRACHELGAAIQRGIPASCPFIQS